MEHLKKTFVNEGGNILVRYCPESQIGRAGIVEVLHLYHNNEFGCVIGAWKVRDVDGDPFPEFYVVHDRLTSIKYSFDILEALRYGQRLAELCMEEQETETSMEQQVKDLIVKYIEVKGRKPTVIWLESDDDKYRIIKEYTFNNRVKPSTSCMFSDFVIDGIPICSPEEAVVIKNSSEREE